MEIFQRANYGYSLKLPKANNPSLIIKVSLICLTCLFPILPDYFRILGLQSYLYPVLLILLIYFCKTIVLKKVCIERSFIKYFSLILIFGIFPYLYNKEFPQAIKFFVINIVLINLIVNEVNSAKIFYLLIDTLIITGIIISIFGLIELLFDYNIFSIIENYFYENNPIFGPSSKYRFGIRRIEQSFNTAITYGVYLTIISFLTMYRLNNSYKKYKYILLIGLILININLFATVSRAPIFICLFFEGVCLFKLYKNNKNKIFLFFPFFFLIMSQLIFNVEFIRNLTNLFISFYDKNYINKISFIENISDLDPLWYRLNIIDPSIDLIKDNILFGIGSTSSWNFKISEFTFSSIDNGYLATLVSFGFFGLINLLIMHLMPLYWALMDIKKDRAKRRCLTFSYIFVIIIISYLLNLFSVARMAESRTIIVLIGLYLSYIKLRGFGCRKKPRVDKCQIAYINFLS